MNVLLVGLKEVENEELGRWVLARGGRAWTAASGLAAMRVFEEVEPDVLVTSTLLPDLDAVRLARTLQASRASLRTVFIGVHRIEEAYHASLDGFHDLAFAHRPLDPEVVFSLRTPDANLDGVVLRGEVDAASMVRLFCAALRHVVSGALYAGEGPNRRVIYFREGRPFYAASTIPSENFGQMLLAAGRITREQFDWARALQAREGILQGVALTQIGVLKESEVDDHLQQHILDKIHALFAMEGAAWHFEVWDRPLRPIQGFRYNTFAVLLDGCRACGAFADLDAETRIRLTGVDEDPVYREVATMLGANTLAMLQAGGTAFELAPHFDDIDAARTMIGILGLAGLVS